MLTPMIALLLILPSSPGDSASGRQIAAPCRLVEERAVQYLEEHDFYTSTKFEGDNIEIALGNHDHALTPSAKLLSLNRFTIRKYTQPRHLSPLKTYYDFRLEGHLVLKKAAEGSCNATLRFQISAYEYVWALGVIDDGYRSKFISNGVLERLYLDPIANLFTLPNKSAAKSLAPTHAAKDNDVNGGSPR